MRQLMISFFMAICLFIFSGIARSQTLDYGIKGGFTLSNLYIDTEDLDDENARIGIHAGLFSQTMLTGNFGFQAEFLFTHKGSEGNYNGLVNQTVNFNLSYIDIPILFVFQPIEIIEIHAGPYFGVLLSSNVKYSGFIDGESEIDRDHLSSVDYGLTGGAGVNFGNLQTGIRYYLGLQRLADSDKARLLLGDSKNSYGQLYVAIKLR
jgi:hypothetical protein